MIKLRLNMRRPKSLVAVLLSSALLLGITTACDEDPAENSIDEILYIDGPGGVAPESTHTYTAGEYGGSVSWSVEGNATLGVANEYSVEVIFGGVGSATISATGGGYSGSYLVNVNEIGAALTDDGVSMVKGVVNDGGTDDVTFTFAAPLTGAPTLALTSGTGSVSTLTGSGTTWTATVTGASADGQLVGQLSNVEVSADYGGGTADSIGVNLQVVDNVSPIITGFSSSASDVQNGTEITISVMLNEAAGSVGDNIIVDYVYGSGSTGQLMLSGEGDTWSAAHTVADGDDMATFTLDKTTVTDLAGNTVTDQGNTWSASVNIDNVAPVPTLSAQENPAGSRVLVVTTSSDAVQWIQLPANSQFEPESISDFDGEGMGSTSFVESPGEYKFYFIEQDAAGNTSPISLLEGVVVAE